MMHYSFFFLHLLQILAFGMLIMTKISAEQGVVVVEITTAAPADSPMVTSEHYYTSMVTLYIENDDGSKTPSGWSTRKEHGALHGVDAPFEFQPGLNLIVGWTEGVLQMKEGERALLHVPSAKGYGGKPMGQKGGAFFIPENSNLLFDIEILGKAGSTDSEF
jgi:hypothetical protein